MKVGDRVKMSERSLKTLPASERAKYRRGRYTVVEARGDNLTMVDGRNHEISVHAGWLTRTNPARKLPKGWIPASAVKIEKRNGVVKVRIKRVNISRRKTKKYAKKVASHGGYYARKAGTTRFPWAKKRR